MKNSKLREYLRSYIASFKQIELKGNIYVALVLYFLIMMFLFSLSRIGFYLYNKDLFSEIPLGKFMHIMAGGLKFDVSAILYTNMLFFFLYLIPQPFRYHRIFRSILKYIFFVFNGIALAANVADFIYYKFTLRRTTFKIFGEFRNEENGFKLFFQFIIDYWYAMLFWIGLIALMVFLFKKVKFNKPKVKNHLFFYTTGIAMMLLFTYLMIGGLRGGFRHSTRPITLSNAGKYVDTPNQMAIVLNTPFSVYRTIGQNALNEKKYFTEEKLSAIYNPVFTPDTAQDFKYNNVIIIILESFAREYFGFYNPHLDNGKYAGYTPFLDSLMNESKVFWYSLANGRKSIDVLPSVLTSIPSVKTPFVLSYYSGNKLNSLPNLLKKKGYNSSFFHGAPNGSMGFQSFVNLVGVDHYYGLTEFGTRNEWDGMWGAWDEDFLRYYADMLDTISEPFISTFFSVSSHHPFKVPEKYEEKFPKGTKPIHQCIHYTDMALEKFFNKIQDSPWYDSTLFVITADHSFYQVSHPEYKTIRGSYSVPLFFYHPGDDLSGIEYKLGQQIDIMPTILNYLNYDEPFIAFGNDLFSADSSRFAVNVLNNTYQLYMGDYLMQYTEPEVVSLYQFKSDSLFQHNLKGTLPEIEEKMLEKMHAFIQQYNNRMIHDQLTITE